nr:MAG TPA: hypothetical protein [Caudoviricetes sp.]
MYGYSLYMYIGKVIIGKFIVLGRLVYLCKLFWIPCTILYTLFNIVYL